MIVTRPFAQLPQSLPAVRQRSVLGHVSCEITMYSQTTLSCIIRSGESYGGHYVPNLAREILVQNAVASNPKINLAGFQVVRALCLCRRDSALRANCAGQRLDDRGQGQ